MTGLNTVNCLNSHPNSYIVSSTPIHVCRERRKREDDQVHVKFSKVKVGTQRVRVRGFIISRAANLFK